MELMPFVFLDDAFHSNPKVLSVGLDGAGLYARALSYCGHYLTDGFVPRGWAREVVGRKQKLLRALTEAGLWREVENGYCIPDYLDFNPPRELVEAQRSELSEKRRVAGQKGAAARWGNGKPHAKPMATPMANAWQTDSPLALSKSKSKPYALHYAGTAGDFQAPENLLRSTP